MSETNVPHGAATGSQQPWAPGTAGDDAGAGGTGVKERVSEAASQVGDVGRETARDARERARDVAHEASDQVHGLADRARSELRTQMDAQQQHLAGGLRSLGDELGQMAGASRDPGYASDLVQRVGDVTGQAARWFEEREPADVLHEVEDFARRRPGTFVLLAAGAGLLVGRFLRGARDASDEDRPDRGGTGSPSTGSSGTGSPSGGAMSSGSMSSGAMSSGTTGTAGTTAAGSPPPAFPPPAPDGPEPYRTGGETYVERP